MLAKSFVKDTERNTPDAKAVTHLNQAELARRWKMSPRTLERWRWRGLGPRFLKIGGHVVYSVAEVEAYEARRLSVKTGPSGFICDRASQREGADTAPDSVRNVGLA